MSGRRRAARPAESPALDLFADDAPPARRPAPRARGPRGQEAVLLPNAALVAGIDPYARPPLDDAYAPVDAYGPLADGALAVREPDAFPGATPGAAIPVGALTQAAKEAVEGAFVPLWVRGEVSDFKAHRNGHWYFTLRDESAQVRCVVWARDARRLPAAPDDGMQVVALGQMSVYAARADLQLVVRTLDAQGDGLWRKALERTRARLDADGLLDPARKRRLPRFPRWIAVVTSPDGAALHDIAVVAARRWPSAQLVVIPARVQGEGAPAELCAALGCAGRWRHADGAAFDVVIIGRGGGAREDLWAFNDEALARAVAACPVPTVSAVGHEVDVTICDLVADLRAPTPSAAAEAVVPVLADVAAELRALGAALLDAVGARVEGAAAEADSAATALRAAAARHVERRRAVIALAAGRLHALSPLATLGRGYAVARAADGGATLSALADFPSGRAFDLRVRDGVVRAVSDGPRPPAPDDATPAAPPP